MQDIKAVRMYNGTLSHFIWNCQSIAPVKEIMDYQNQISIIKP
jgi:hypothetical protein